MADTPDPRVERASVDAGDTPLATFDTIERTLEAVLPSTYFADLLPVDRVRKLVKAWQRAIEVNAQLESENDAARAQAARLAEALRALSDSCVMSDADVADPWAARRSALKLADAALAAYDSGETPNG